MNKRKVINEELKIGIIGLGYVGLPLALSFLQKNINVIGFDIDEEKIKKLLIGKSYLLSISNDEICDFVEKKTFSCYSTFENIKNCNVVIICVPTPLTDNFDPDLSSLISTCKSIASHLQKNTLVSLESTSWPGTTEEIVKPILEENKELIVGENLYLCFSPEREDPGNTEFKTVNIPKLLGGYNDESLERGRLIYSLIFKKIILLSSIKIAEATKLYENIFRNVNIALVNELMMAFEKMNIDIWEVIEAAKTKPFGFMPFFPGPGVGGHCIPVDPIYLTWKAKQYMANTPLIDLAILINRSMPNWVVGKIQSVLNEKSKAVKGAKILIIGVAYKPDVEDLRESPALEIIEKLKILSADVSFYDPLVGSIKGIRHHERLNGMRSVLPSKDYDCFVIITTHKNFSYSNIFGLDVPIIDTRNFIKKNQPLKFMCIADNF